MRAAFCGLLLVLFAAAGCGGGEVVVAKKAAVPKGESLSLLVPDFASSVKKGPRPLAEAAFADDPGRLVADMCAQQFLQVADVVVVDRDRLRAVMEQEKLKPADLNRPDVARKLAKTFGSQAMLAGDVKELYWSTSLVKRGAAAAASIKMVHLESGAVLFSGDFNKSSHISNDVNGVVREGCKDVVQSIIAQRSPGGAKAKWWQVGPLAPK